MYLSVAMAWVNCKEYENTSTLQNDLVSVLMRMERLFDREGDSAKWWSDEKERVRTGKAPWADALEGCS